MARASKRSFVSRIVSKVTEIKNILAEVAALTAEKTNLQSDPVTNAQVITEKTQRIELKTKKIENKVKRSEEKVNVIVVKKIEEKITASLIAPSDEDYEPVSLLSNKSISFNNSIYYNNDGSIDDLSYFFGPNVVSGYFRNRFVIFKGQNAIDYLRIGGQLENTTDSRGYYNFSQQLFRKNYPKYKRNDIWILYDNLNDIVYYNNYTGNNFPTKKWYRPDILYKTSIELKVKTIESSGGSGSGSGSSESGSGSSGGSGGAVGINVLDYITEDADKIIWDYAEDRFEPYGNYILKTAARAPFTSNQIVNIFNNSSSDYSIILPLEEFTLSYIGIYVKPQQRSINSSSNIPLNRAIDLIPNGIAPSQSPDFISVVPTYSSDDAAVAAIQKYENTTGLYFYNQNHKASRTPKKLLPGPDPTYYEMYDDGKIYNVQGNISSSAIKYASYSTNLNILTGVGDTQSAYTLFATGAYNMFAERPSAAVVLKQDSKIEIQYTLGGRHQHEIPNSLTKENINNIVLYNNTYPAGAVIYILDNSGNLYCSDTLNNNPPSWILRDTGVRQITFNSTWIFAGITNDFNLKKYQNNFGDSDFADYPSGIIITGNKYRLISSKYAVRHFE